MDCWAVLGIAPTSDTAVIRRAYKQQLLVCHPEDDPEGYQKVRAAYTAAMSAAKLLIKHEEAATETTGNVEVERNNADAPADGDERAYQRLFRLESTGPIEDDESEQDEGQVKAEHLTARYNFIAQQAQDKTQAVNDFMARLEQLIHDSSQQNNPAAWKELLSDEILWDFQLKPRIENRMLQLLSRRYSWLQDPIWNIIESHLGLMEKMINQADEYPARFVDTYAIATQKIDTPRQWKKAVISKGQIIRNLDISWWRYCFKIPIIWTIYLIIGNVFTITLYLLWVLVRSILYVFRRNWKIIMWEYTFSYFNRWGKRYDFKYIDITRIVWRSNSLIIYLRGKRIRVRNRLYIMNLDHLLAKMNRYGKMEGNTLYIE
ncbi:J domain-containing protein [Paenibacillus xylaniclasticus]|uniref:J domain-containing protein n=1 Tax=Paenibacillus xylaniclasticus TaxID=588083 RepID=UPI000FDBA146|nr:MULTISPECIES: J domain-containing protein [Paenibacillus]GFN31446.1 hypothetical protein PCURB6_17060 [Paenibacillus curdlanolyticus]